MARFGTFFQRTASTTLDVGSILTAAASPRRFAMYDFMLGSEAAAADNALLWRLGRRTGTATAGTAPAIVPLDFTDAVASTLVANQAPTTDGAGTDVLIQIPLNQRATFRWVAAPGGELVSSIAASNGYGFDTPTAPGTPAVTASIQVLEY
jgi:hypothetical protein